MTGEDHGFQVQSNGIYSGYIESHVFLAKARLIQCRRGEKKSLLWIKNKMNILNQLAFLQFKPWRHLNFDPRMHDNLSWVIKMTLN